MNNNKYFSTEEAAEYLSMNQRTIQKWCAKGMLPSAKIGRKFIIYKEEIDQILGENKNTKK
jgi:excisionase family DNA binding protein